MATNTDLFNKPLKEDTESYRDQINSINESGKRNWVFAKKPQGRFTKAREIVAVFLLALLFTGPFIKINGNPILMFNILERKFTLFGMVFWPADFHLAVLAMLTGVLFIVIFTAIFGRVWCGWACPQTIFMEMVFRKIEYWIEGDRSAQIRLDKAPWNTEKITKKVSKQGIFFAISFLIANTFLAYIIGIDQLWEIVTDPPSEHLAGLASITLFSFVFYMVFARFREQVCHFACPYGRFQSVLIDEDSLAVSYDFVRGEPRGNMKDRRKAEKQGKSQPVSTSSFSVAELADDPSKAQELSKTASTAFGSCIDCGECVRVCPMGIDIRNGIQLECVQCTACIDACDNVMDKINEPRGLVRYSSLNGIKNKDKKFKITPRIIAYSVVLTILLSVLTGLLVMREDTQSIILRSPGVMYQQIGDGSISNMYETKILNKTFRTIPYEIKLLTPENGTIRAIGQFSSLDPQSVTQGKLLLILPPESISENGRTSVTFGVYSEGELIEEVTTGFISPTN